MVINLIEFPTLEIGAEDRQTHRQILRGIVYPKSTPELAVYIILPEAVRPASDQIFPRQTITNNSDSGEEEGARPTLPANLNGLCIVLSAIPSTALPTVLPQTERISRPAV